MYRNTFRILQAFAILSGLLLPQFARSADRAPASVRGAHAAEQRGALHQFQSPRLKASLAGRSGLPEDAVIEEASPMDRKVGLFHVRSARDATQPAFTKAQF